VFGLYNIFFHIPDISNIKAHDHSGIADEITLFMWKYC